MPVNTMAPVYDPQCEYLARYFLKPDAPQEQTEALAAHIQQSVEEFMTCEDDEDEAA